MTGSTLETGESSNKNETIDFDDPLYLHNNIVTTIISFKLLGTKIFRIWRSSMTKAMKARNKIGFVDGTFVKMKDNHVKSL